MRKILSLVLVSTAALSTSSVWAQATHPVQATALHGISAQEATLVWSRGSVVISTTPSSSDSRPAVSGQTLSRGMRVHVGDGASAELALANGSVLVLGERSQVLMFASPTPTSPDQPPSVTTTLQRGVMRLRMSRDPNAALMPIATGSATVFVGRSDAVVSADLGGHITRAAVHRGRMRVRTMTREYILRAGSGSFEEFGRPPQPYRQLPAQPVWTTPLPERVISGGEPVDVSASYGIRGAGAVAHWRVEFANEPSFREPISSERVGAEVTRWHNPQLQPGTYYLRVTALDQDRFESLPSAVGRVTVAAPRIEAGAVGAGGETGRLAQVNVPEGFRCGLDGAAPAATTVPLRLAPGRSHRLLCTTETNPRDVREIRVPAAQAGPLLREVRMRELSYGESVLAVRLFDAEGRAVPYAEITVRNDRGVTVDPVREAPERGVYNGAVHWPRGVTRARFSFVINGDEAFEQELTQAQ